MERHTETEARCIDCERVIDTENDCFSRPLSDGHEIGYLCQDCEGDAHYRMIGYRAAREYLMKVGRGEDALLSAVAYGDDDVEEPDNFTVCRNRPICYILDSAQEDGLAPMRGICNAVTLSCAGLFLLCLFVIAIREALR